MDDDPVFDFSRFTEKTVCQFWFGSLKKKKKQNERITGLMHARTGKEPEVS
jgi:hypothetical protein